MHLFLHLPNELHVLKGYSGSISIDQKHLKMYKLRMKNTAAGCFREAPPKRKLEMLKRTQPVRNSALISKRPSCRGSIKMNDIWRGLGWERPVKHKHYFSFLFFINSKLYKHMGQWHNNFLVPFINLFKNTFQLHFIYTVIGYATTSMFLTLLFKSEIKCSV